MRNVILTTSSLSVGEDMSKGSGDARESDFDFDEE